MDLLLATNNKHKVIEIKKMLQGKFDNIFTLKDLNVQIEVEEDGDTFFENSLKKAKEISEATGYITLADDSGLEVDALGGQPGVHSARYAGGHDDCENNKKLLKNMQGVENRSARFITCIVLYYPNGKYIFADGVVEGRVIEQLKGSDGFGYDPLFYSIELEKTFGEATLEEKNTVSHRARALAILLEKLNNL